MRVNGTDGRLAEAEPEVPAELVRSLPSVLRRRLGLDTAWLSTFSDGAPVFANRSAAWSRLEQLDAADAGYSVLFCDTERFKAVNDRRGHRVGDQLLVRVAERLMQRRLRYAARPRPVDQGRAVP